MTMVSEKIEAIFSDFSKAIPEDLQYLKRDFEQNVKSALNASLSKMDLVTREEFDIQAALLQRTRVKLDALRLRLMALEKKLQDTSD